MLFRSMTREAVREKLARIIDKQAFAPIDDPRIHAKASDEVRRRSAYKKADAILALLDERETPHAP